MDVEDHTDTEGIADQGDKLALEFVEKVQQAMADLLHARIKDLTDGGITLDRISNSSPAYDNDCQYVWVDGIPVYRAIIAFEEDGVRLIGSWIPRGLDALETN